MPKTFSRTPHLFFVMVLIVHRLLQNKRNLQYVVLQVSEVIGGYSKVRRTWKLMGQRMSPKCVAAVLGIGNFRVARLKSGQKDRRYRIWGGVYGCNRYFL